MFFSPAPIFTGKSAPGKWPCAFPYLVLCHPTSRRSKAVPWWTTTKQVVGGWIAIARFLYFLVVRWSSCFCFLVKVSAILSPLNFSSRNSFCVVCFLGAISSTVLPSLKNWRVIKPVPISPKLYISLAFTFRKANSGHFRPTAPTLGSESENHGRFLRGLKQKYPMQMGRTCCKTWKFNVSFGRMQWEVSWDP